ncbi:hypothetical protein RR45_GL000727 [Lactococcus chungangensis CAU 28 = DSM 22330]|uniref:Uncharacterized protein n=1 Tax=Pseudolactococcus chungangensis CAU 28 = DSM 22330 TaxID=1122154 RepID=A0A1K2H904_9LACT|nr:hypothetical protein [Lactococcus chungangensis]PCS02019.1 hypothetical protein RR45_GL000727 [Lactococcus chungangensis CAU 28 = DSM 22330]SFZ73004.1 hypothetical protein SAMN02746068_00720 [Lactococcus chungangensis CAU 28 = DSM 22330]
MSSSFNFNGFSEIEKALSKEIEKGAKEQAIDFLKTNGFDVICPFCDKEFLARTVHETCPNCSKTIDIDFNVTQS